VETTTADELSRFSPTPKKVPDRDDAAERDQNWVTVTLIGPTEYIVIVMSITISIQDLLSNKEPFITSLIMPAI
jgi:translation elongation factor EF-4